MMDNKDVHLQVFSEYDSHMIQVLNPEGDRVLFSKVWNHNNADLGVGGELNFVELLKFLGYNVYHEEVY